MIKLALRRPITIMVIIMGVMLFSFMAVQKIAIDIFPAIDLPTIYVSQPYGGMSPEQMEGLLSTRYEDQFLYVTGIKHIEVKNIQGTSVLKLAFYEGTNMAQASGEVATLVNRSQAFMPPGTVPPIVIRFDASSLPVGQLVFSAPNRSLNDLQLAAQRFVRPMFSSIPGVSSPPPFGGSSRTIVVRANPELLRSHNTTADEVVEAISKSNKISAAGNVRIGDYAYMTPVNTLVDKPEELLDIPIHTGSGPAVYVRDIGTVQDASDVITSYALVNGRRAVYIPVLKRADASTWSVVKNIKAALPKMQAAIPEDIKVSYEFDQSVYVINAVKSLMTEGITGAILTGLMVLLFLGDFKSSIIVILTIPISVLAAVLLLFLFGQTINIMTLSGLALAIGILVDQATVAIENIHQHLEMGKSTARAVSDAIKEVSFPLLLILLCVLAVFAPALMMTGVPKSMFLPISLSVGFAMVASFLLSQTFVPVLANWLLKGHKPHKQESHFAIDTEEAQMVKHEHRAFQAIPEKKLKGFQLFRHRFTEILKKLMAKRKVVIIYYVIGVFAIIGFCFYSIGEDILPKVNSGQFQVRLRAPDGTRLERTEEKLLKVIDMIKQEVGPEHVAITSAFVGTQPNTYPEAAVYQFMSGSHEALLQVNLTEGFHVKMDELKERLRAKIKTELPELRVSFEPIELVDKVMSQGSPTPVEIMVAGKDLEQGKVYANRVKGELSKISFLRDVQIAQPINYPVINIHIDRDRAAQMGLTPDDISKSLVASTSSSRYTNKVFWLDHKIGVGYQVQLQVPEPVMKDMNDIQNISLKTGQIRPTLGDVATLSIDTVPGEYDHYDSKRVITITANVYNKDLNTAAKAVNKVLLDLGQLPRGMEIKTKGLLPLLEDMLGSLQNGLLVAIVVIFLLLSANYQSFKVSLAVLSTIPAVLAGSLIMLIFTGSTLNLQSYMGIIMSVGVSVANAILLVTNAENLRLSTGNAYQSALTSASIRLRPILMTSVAMIVGMIPMAAGLGEAGEQSAPLGRAVIGGLLASTLAALLILPCVFAQIQDTTSTKSVSLDPDDAESPNYSIV